MAIAIAGCTSDTGPVLLKPAPETSLNSMDASRLPAARASNRIKSAYPVQVDRLAIESDTLFVEIDGKKIKFVGKLHPGCCPPQDAWTGETETGDQAQVMRMVESMTGSFTLGERRFGFGGRGQYAIFFELDPTHPTREEQEEEQVAAAEARVRRQAAAASTPPPKPPSREEMCAQKAQFLKDFAFVNEIAQPTSNKEWIKKVFDGVQAEQLALGC